MAAKHLAMVPVLVLLAAMSFAGILQASRMGQADKTVRKVKVADFDGPGPFKWNKLTEKAQTVAMIRPHAPGNQAANEHLNKAGKSLDDEQPGKGKLKDASAAAPAQPAPVPNQELTKKQEDVAPFSNSSFKPSALLQEFGLVENAMRETKCHEDKTECEKAERTLCKIGDNSLPPELLRMIPSSCKQRVNCQHSAESTCTGVSGCKVSCPTGKPEDLCPSPCLKDVGTCLDISDRGCHYDAGQGSECEHLSCKYRVKVEKPKWCFDVSNAMCERMHHAMTQGPPTGAMRQGRGRGHPHPMEEMEEMGSFRGGHGGHHHEYLGSFAESTV